MDGHTWTSDDALAERIDASQDNEGGMVVFNIDDYENFIWYRNHLAGICTEQKEITSEVIEYRARIEDHVCAADSKSWAIQLCLIPS